MYNLKKIFLLILIIITTTINVYSYTNISSCQDLNANTEYRLISDIQVNGACMNFEDNTTLNCQGYTITGNGSGDGFYFHLDTNSSAHNCKINNFNQGINILTSMNSLVENSTIINSTEKGFSNYANSHNTTLNRLYIKNCNENTLYGTNTTFSNSIIDNATNLEIRTKYSSYYNISIYNARSTGLVISNTDDANNTFNYLKVINSTGHGYSYNSANGGNKIFNSYFENNSGIGITLRNDIGINITSLNNDQNGIAILEPSILNNSISKYNNQDGIYLIGNNISILNSIITNNNEDGIGTASGNYYVNRLIKNNIIANNSRYGYSANTHNSFFINNIFTNNSNHDIVINSGENNTFYLNTFSNISKLANIGTNNYFNYTTSEYGNIGNYWTEFIEIGCNQTKTINRYSVCTNPSNFTINQARNLYDFKPLYTSIVNETVKTNKKVTLTSLPSNNYLTLTLTTIMIVLYLII